MTFSERLKAIRLAKGLTQLQVSQSTGMSLLGYQRYEYGSREPAYNKLLTLADFFDVSLDYLVGRTDKPEVNN